LRIADEACGSPMNKLPRNLGTSRPIDIGAEADFSLGGLTIHPSTREVSAGDRRESIEPRVMQVLVALARGEGGVLSRDQLIELCWGGRLVSDDAINSSVAKVRALAALTAPSAFEIETIPRVGYRLHARAEPDAQATVSSAAPAAETASRLPWRYAAGVVMLLAVGMVGFFVLRPLFAPQPREWVIAESRMAFIETPLIERNPTFSPDGTMVAYTAGTNLTDRRIYLRLLRGGDPIVLTRDMTGALAPAWSPDGSTIAYVRFEKDKPCRIMLIGAPAGTSRQVGQCRSAPISFLVWDRSGSALYFSDSTAPDLPSHIFRLDLGNGSVRELKRDAPASASDNAVAASHDGKTLLFVRALGKNLTQIVLHDLASDRERIFLQSDDFDLDAALSDDDRTVFVSRTRRWDSSVSAYPVSGGPPQSILTGASQFDALVAGPNGLVALDLESSTSQLAATVSSPDQAPNAFDRSGRGWAFPDYAPDGTLAALGWTSAEGIGIWIAEPGKPMHELARLQGCACDMRWSPTGDALAYAVSDGSQYRISVSSRNGMTLARFISRQPVNSIDWTADGKALLTTRQDAKGWRIWRTDLAHTDTSAPVSDYGWSFLRVRGDKLFGLKSATHEIWRIDGTPRRLTPALEDTQATFWNVSKDRVLYPDFSDQEHPRIMAVPFDGGSPAVAGYAPDLWHNSFLAADPTSGRIVYVRLVSEDADIGWIRLTQK
jgi:DNA-binding winged helix-turn-helix (wHTH) protein/Tol biopolymer transport system component